MGTSAGFWIFMTPKILAQQRVPGNKMGLLHRDGRHVACVFSLPMSVHVGMYYAMLAQALPS